MVMDVVLICLELAGALALFMYGMQLTSDGLQRAAGDRLQKTVNLMTKNRFIALFTGLFVTVLIQSSSVTTVMVVSFVNAGLLNLIQAIGVIMGANIGTTVTAWIVAAIGIQKFSIVALAVPIFGLGFFMSIMKKRGDAFRSYGEALMGFALLFLGLEYLSKAIPTPSGETLHLLQKIEGLGRISVLIGVATGMVFTILLHSSSATTAIIIGIAAKGIISFDMAAALTLGANIGTTIDAFLVSIGTNVHARRAAWAHIIFNVFGTLWVIVVFEPFIAFVDWVVPGTITPATIGPHIAMLHTLFNTTNALVMLPFVNRYAQIISKFVKEKPGEADRRKLVYVASPFTSSPELNMVQAQKEISVMADVAETLFVDFRQALNHPPADLAETVEHAARLEAYADSMREGITKFLLEIARQDITEKTKDNISVMMHVVNELESVTDGCLSLMYLLDRAAKKKIKIDKDEIEKLGPYAKTMEEFLHFVKTKINAKISESELVTAATFENSIDALRSDLKKVARKRLKAGAEVKAELLFIDMVRIIEKIGDYAFSIAEALREIRK